MKLVSLASKKGFFLCADQPEATRATRKKTGGQASFLTLMALLVGVCLKKIVGLTTNSHEITKGTAPVHSKNSPEHPMKVPDRFGESRKNVFFRKIEYNIIDRRY